MAETASAQLTAPGGALPEEARERLRFRPQARQVHPFARGVKPRPARTQAIDGRDADAAHRVGIAAATDQRTLFAAEPGRARVGAVLEEQGFRRRSAIERQTVRPAHDRELDADALRRPLGGVAQRLEQLPRGVDALEANVD